MLRKMLNIVCMCVCVNHFKFKFFDHFNLAWVTHHFGLGTVFHGENTAIWWTCRALIFFFFPDTVWVGAPRWCSVVQKPRANAGDERDTGSVPGSGRSPGEGNGNSLQCSCLENSMDRGAWRATVHGVTESDAIERLWLSTHTCKFGLHPCNLGFTAPVP